MKNEDYHAAELSDHIEAYLQQEQDNWQQFEEEKKQVYISKPLYQIRQDHINLLQQIEDNEGELTPELEQALILTKENLEAKAVSYGFVIKEYEDKEGLIDKEILRLSERKERAVKKKELFKQKLSEGLRQFGIEKVETATMKLSFRKSESVEIIDQSKIPSRFILEKVSREISRSKIKDSIKAGVLVPGAELKANYNLQIK